MFRNVPMSAEPAAAAVVVGGRYGSGQSRALLPAGVSHGGGVALADARGSHAHQSRASSPPRAFRVRARTDGAHIQSESERAAGGSAAAGAVGRGCGAAGRPRARAAAAAAADDDAKMKARSRLEEALSSLPRLIEKLTKCCSVALMSLSVNYSH